MSRKRREKSLTGIYHVIWRGVNQQIIFEEDSDYLSFLNVLREYKEQIHFSIYAYCLMDNHLHLLMKAGEEDMGVTMKRIGVKFTRWYNTKYNRTGGLIQGRYKSEPIGDNSYFLTVFRYIHQNPINGGAEKILGEYPWSSWHDYVENRESWIDTEMLLSYFGSREQCREFLSVMTHEKGYEGIDTVMLSDRDALDVFYEVSDGLTRDEMNKIDIARRDAIIREMYERGAGMRQISRVTGVSRVSVAKTCRKG